MSTKPDFGVTEQTRPEEAVKLAIERERTAREFYLRCASIVADPGVKRMFEFLAAEEEKHQSLLEREYDRFIAGEN
ncbi:MAG TPA: ferritin family protein [Thermoanaerobaculaceae bacterium]|nr:ferritin family protein [Thermoanaerobaculaceae bacterium]HRS14952.1 ferritin family protein [Thermoanaerobaculaceae bacterium]